MRLYSKPPLVLPLQRRAVIEGIRSSLYSEVKMVTSLKIVFVVVQIANDDMPL